jgi:hypothetical protein
VMEMVKPVVNDFGGAPIAEHNIPCAVCWTRPAVYNLSAQKPLGGKFSPCWICQEEGWFLSRVQPHDPIGSLLRKWFI